MNQSVNNEIWSDSLMIIQRLTIIKIEVQIGFGLSETEIERKAEAKAESVDRQREAENRDKYLHSLVSNAASV